MPKNLMAPPQRKIIKPASALEYFSNFLSGNIDNP